MPTEQLAWVVLLAPLFAAVGITLFTRPQPALSARFAIAAVVVSFVLSAGLFLLLPKSAAGTEVALDWLTVGAFNVKLGLRLDGLSLPMLLIVTGVAAAVHIYSYGYMHEDPGFSRYFASLGLFTFSMLGIVLSSNLLQMFIFWELVGVSSYLLIGFWHERAAAADACKKAFLTNRLGDFGFILGILVVWSAVGSLDIAVIEQKIVANPGVLGALSGVAGLLIFCGAMGKSAQFPLHVWLPDAMEGPTPVSALIHAATMVAAGVYMLCRVFFLYTATPAWPEALSFLQGITALDFIAWIGGITALLAALIAVQQNDIKRILAYSTLSQLGYMVMAVGLSSPAPAMYHLTTHAFFKAMLFLGAGSVIHALHHEQDIWKMGGLKNYLPVTFKTFLIGTLALSGVPPFSGFYSKDEILAAAYHHNLALFILALVVAGLTTFYMFRLVFVAFFGEARSESAHHAHESPKIMTVPLMVLAVPSVLAGLFGIGHLYQSVLGKGGHAAAHSSLLQEVFAPFGHAPLAAICGLGVTVVGLVAAWSLYWNAKEDRLPVILGALSRGMRNRFYFDEIYDEVVTKTHDSLAALADWIDRWIVAGLLVRGLHGTTELVGRALRLAQTGSLQTHTFLFVAGAALVLFLVMYR